MFKSPVEADLSDTWLEEFAAEGIVALERLLDSHARFQTWTEEHDVPPA